MPDIVAHFDRAQAHLDRAWELLLRIGCREPVTADDQMPLNNSITQTSLESYLDSAR